jgi:uncharacterized protein
MDVRWEDIPPEGREIALEELHPFCLQGPHGEEEQEARIASTTKGKLVLRRTSKGIEVKGRIETAVAVPCARCLKEFILPIVAEFEESLILKRYAPPDEDTELLQSEMDISFLPEGGIEPRDIVEEQVWLNIPMKPLCHDGCKGLCNLCGADLNLGECGCDRQQVDPRFAVLKGFKTNLSHGRR